MRRQLDRNGERVLTEWLDHYKPLGETRNLIAEAIRAFATDENQIRFYSYSDISNPGITIIEPREGLTVHFRAWRTDPSQFTIVRIIDEGEPT
jgi:hypothetical protein